VEGDLEYSQNREETLRKLGVPEEDIPYTELPGPPYGDDWTHTILHETGHALDHAMGWPSTRDIRFLEWAGRAFPASSYPATNPRETFAELFAALRFGVWKDPSGDYPELPEEAQARERAYVERAEHEGVPLKLAQQPEPLCIARYLPDGRLWFGPPGSAPNQ
jgi:hypothetical protein